MINSGNGMAGPTQFASTVIAVTAEGARTVNAQMVIFSRSTAVTCS